MFLYSFTRYAGHDRVFISTLDGVSEGDLLVNEKEYYLVLGENVAWKEQYKYTLRDGAGKLTCQIKGLLSKKTMNVLHWFVNEWYTSYKNSVPLFLGDIEEIMKRQKNIKKSKRKKAIKSENICKNNEFPFLYEENTINIKKGLLDKNVSGQQLIVFSDIWTMKNSSLNLSSLDEKEYSLLHGQSTKKQTAEAFWGIKNGTTKILFCTYSQLFQERKNLERIVLVDSHKRRYKNQKDPRYYVPCVVDYLGRVYGCDVVKIGWEMGKMMYKNDTKI